MGNLKPLFISLIDETNTPILIHVMSYEAKDVNKILKYNTFSNISLDFFESSLFQWDQISINYKNGNSPIRMLFEVENVTVFGMWMKPSGLKIIVGFNASDNFENENDSLIIFVFEKIKKIYMRVKSNPFFDLGQASTDKNNIVKFEEKFEQEFGTEVQL
ncbi:Tca17p PWA37_001007 [Arxiozyma heterogenica]|uniref:Uncharacterized protein n=1 Tax=Arxiozyma heterogenica TaxID=278026 RepID=A0AAN7ZXT2_9SACH|nr:hypothetical protein RI543_002914 [Kazachstania heterogenica]